MTLSEAIQAVEDEVQRIEWRDKGYEKTYPAQMLGVVSCFHGQLFAQVEDDFAAGRLGNEEYVEAMRQLIREFERYEFRNKVDRKLASLMRSA